MAKKPTSEEIERDVIHHVQRYAEYHARLKEPYCVHYDGKIFSSADTRDLVIKIMREAHGITVKS